MFASVWYVSHVFLVCQAINEGEECTWDYDPNIKNPFGTDKPSLPYHMLNRTFSDEKDPYGSARDKRGMMYNPKRK